MTRERAEHDSGDHRETIHVTEMPSHIFGNVLIDGPDGQCTRYYAGIDERCPNDAVAHTYTSGKIVEMCADCCPVGIPEPPEAEQAELVTDGGEEVADRDHHEKLRWCEGCQSNVKPKFGGFGWECPLCGSSLGGLLNV